MPAPSTTTSTATAKGTAKGKVAARKATPKKVVPESERARRLFSSLCSQIEGGHFTNAIKTCDKILRIDPSDADALETKLYLLFQTDQHEAALEVLAWEKDGSKFVFERAYALYRSHEDGKAEELIKTLKERDPDDRGLAHLEAQMLYRQGSYQEAHTLYNELLGSTDPDTEEYSDILTNLQAVQKHLDFINNGFLRAIDTLPVLITSTIETAPPPTLVSSMPAVLLPEQPTSTALEDKPKKVRMSRVPPGVIPGVTPPPDPERWLKKSERSTYNQGRRRRGGGSTQGSAALDAPSGGASASKGGSKGKRKK